MGKKVNKTRNKSSAWFRPVQDSLWSKIQSRTWLCPIQVHYWVKQPGKKSIAATVKSKSSMGKPWTENSRAVINFSPHCSHHLHWSLWGNRLAPFALRTATGGFEFSPSAYTLLRQSSHTTWVFPIYTRTGGLRPEGGGACLRKCERRRDPNTSHTNSDRFRLHTHSQCDSPPSLPRLTS